MERHWSALEQRLRTETYPAMVDDPYFTVNVKGLLQRYLAASKYDVREALIRLEATAKWRKEWNVLDYYRAGAAAELFSEDSNPGAEMYFADSLLMDKEGRPYAAGRLKFANPENMHPWHHLRAGVLVFELMATKVAPWGKVLALISWTLEQWGRLETSVALQATNVSTMKTEIPTMLLVLAPRMHLLMRS